MELVFNQRMLWMVVLERLRPFLSWSQKKEIRILCVCGSHTAAAWKYHLPTYLTFPRTLLHNQISVFLSIVLFPHHFSASENIRVWYELIRKHSNGGHHAPVRDKLLFAQRLSVAVPDSTHAEADCAELRFIYAHPLSLCNGSAQCGMLNWCVLKLNCPSACQHHSGTAQRTTSCTMHTNNKIQMTCGVVIATRIHSSDSVSCFQRATFLYTKN